MRERFDEQYEDNLINFEIVEMAQR
jgi:hypothetical protein